MVAAIAVFFVRRGSQAYGPEDDPAGVVRNYLLTVNQEDYSRAYGYLAEEEYKPDEERFRQDFLLRRLEPVSVAVQILSARTTGDEAVVELVLIHASPGPFNEGYRENSKALLVQDAQGRWKLKSMPYPYWGWDWYTSSLQKAPNP